jgi:hypothetical protein
MSDKKEYLQTDEDYNMWKKEDDDYEWDIKQEPNKKEWRYKIEDGELYLDNKPTSEECKIQELKVSISTPSQELNEKFISKINEIITHLKSK